MIKLTNLLSEAVNSSLVKKMIKAVNKGEDVVVYDKKGKKYSLQSGDNKAVAVTDYLGSERTYQTLPLSKVKKIVIEVKLTESSDTFVNILNKFGFKKGARDWGGHQFFVHKSKDLYATYNPNGRSLVIEPKRGGKPVFDSTRSNFSIKALLNYLQSPKNKFVSTEGGL